MESTSCYKFTSVFILDAYSLLKASHFSLAQWYSPGMAFRNTITPGWQAATQMFVCFCFVLLTHATLEIHTIQYFCTDCFWCKERIEIIKLNLWSKEIFTAGKKHNSDPLKLVLQPTIRSPTHLLRTTALDLSNFYAVMSWWRIYYLALSSSHLLN